MHSLYQRVGLNTQAHGIVFTVPIDDTVGFKDDTPLEHQDLTDQE